jgi:UDP-N-acetylmuramate--alanine ligase
METYGHDPARLRQAFVEFTQRLPFYGTAILCVDDPGVRQIMPFISKPLLTYGCREDAQLRASALRAEGSSMHFAVERDGRGPLQVELNLPGRHNVLNALAAIAVASELDLPDDALLSALREFKGVGRRFQSYGDLPAQGGGYFRLIDDYGHHPVEMAAVLSAARGAFPGRRILLAFQPHRFTRTRDLFEDFVAVLGQADGVLLSEVYAAGESAIVAADGRSLARALRVAGKVEPLFCEDLKRLQEAVIEHARDGDVVIAMGAGSIGSLAANIQRSLVSEHQDD